MASETPTVLYCHASMPCLRTAPLTVFARSSTGQNDLVISKIRLISDQGLISQCILNTSQRCYSHHIAYIHGRTAYLHGLPSHQTEATPT